MKSGFKLISLAFIVLFAAYNNTVFCQSDKPFPRYPEPDTQARNVSNFTNSRLLIKFPKPECAIADSGIVVVIVRINKNGRVIKAQVDKIKSTTHNKMLYNSALKAAAYAKYNSIVRDTIETGQLIYKFKLD
jgi:TonB family protein